MSDWFRLDDDRFEHDLTSKTLVSEPVQAEDIPYVDAGKLDLMEKASIERAITERDQHILGLRSNIHQIQTERLALETQLSELQADHSQLKQRVREFETTRPSLEPNAVFSSVASSFDAVEASLSDATYSIRDVDVRLKANVIQTDKGLRMHLPSLDERSATETLSEFSFRLQSGSVDAATETAEDDYLEIPDLIGRSQSAAVDRLTAAGLTRGELTLVEEPAEPPGTVIEQFPEPYLLAPPDAPVDLVIATTPEPSTDATKQSNHAGDQANESADSERVSQESAHDQSGQPSETVTETIAETDLAFEAELTERLERAGIETIDELLEFGPERLAKILGYPAEQIKPLYEQLVAHHTDTAAQATLAETQQAEEKSQTAEKQQTTAEKTAESTAELPLESIDGIGPTYAGRLADAGVTGVRSLAGLDPERVAKITRTSVSRSTGWIEQARHLVRER